MHNVPDCVEDTIYEAIKPLQFPAVVEYLKQLDYVDKIYTNKNLDKINLVLANGNKIAIRLNDLFDMHRRHTLKYIQCGTKPVSEMDFYIKGCKLELDRGYTR